MRIKHFKIILFTVCTILSVNAQQAPQKTFTEKLDGIKTSGKELTKSGSVPEYHLSST